MSPRVTVETAGESTYVDYSLAFDRSTLPAYGDYAPNHDNRSGLVPGTNLADLEPVLGNSEGVIYLTSATTHVNKIFWGEIRVEGPGVKFKNCIRAGANPELIDDDNNGTVRAGIRCYGSKAYEWTDEDGLFDGQMWLNSEIRPTVPMIDGHSITLTDWRRRADATVGIWGGWGHLYRSQIKNFGDGTNWVQKISDPRMDSMKMQMYGCWTHGMSYDRNPGAADGAHPDIWQAGIGKHFYALGSYFGGARDSSGFDQSPPYNAGDDAQNAAVMMKQEVDVSAANLLEDIIFEKCFFEGGLFSVNYSWGSDRPNPGTTVKFIDGRFPYRDDGKYIIRHLNVSNSFVNNRLVTVNKETGQFTLGDLVPIRRG